MSRLILNNIDVLVVSFGGVGTTSVMEFLSEHLKLNCPYDRDGLKHLPWQPYSSNANLRCIYVFDDPVLATLSLFRRNYQSLQSRKLNPNKWPLARARVQRGQSLNEYLESGEDLLGLTSHFDNWHGNALAYPTLFIRFDALWERVDDLLQFLDLPIALASKFPERRHRSSTLEMVDGQALMKLSTLYAELSDRLMQLGDVHRVEPPQYCPRLLRFLCYRGLAQMPLEAALFRAKRLSSRLRQI